MTYLVENQLFSVYERNSDFKQVQVWAQLVQLDFLISIFKFSNDTLQ